MHSIFIIYLALKIVKWILSLKSFQHSNNNYYPQIKNFFKKLLTRIKIGIIIKLNSVQN
ncbi:MAG: hypothetical protein XD49_0428 [Caldanaerobacter subterraneus]|nr:MAG: hypothetical protein XD49_0428 [Caldanaerobacter subterraneus]